MLRTSCGPARFAAPPRLRPAQAPRTPPEQSIEYASSFYASLDRSSMTYPRRSCIPRTRVIITAVPKRTRTAARVTSSGAAVEARVRPQFSAAPLLIAAALIGLNVFVYSSVSHFELVNWDDSTYLTENPTVLSGLSWSTVWWALTTGHSPYWHPMTWLSHLLDVTLFGPDAGAYHVTNLVLHVASTLVLFGILRRMTRALWPSAFVAAIFAVHPLHVESVAWIAERKDVLSTLFWMLTVAAYVWY